MLGLSDYLGIAAWVARIAPVFRPLRAAIGVGVLGLLLWAAFAIDLGGKTFADHVDTISETPEAQELIEGARSTVNPALSDVRDRVLGEYVEAPTWIPEDQTVPASTRIPELDEADRSGDTDRGEPPLPGARRRIPGASLSDELDDHGHDEDEPPLPGTRRRGRMPFEFDVPVGPREAGPSEPVYTH